MTQRLSIPMAPHRRSAEYSFFGPPPSPSFLGETSLIPMSDGDARERETDAITKIQATFKGNKTREETAPMRAKWSGRSDMLKLWRSGLTRVRLRLMAARCLHIEDTFFAREYAVQYERHNLYLAKLRNGVSAAHGALNTYRDVKTSLLHNPARADIAAASAGVLGVNVLRCLGYGSGPPLDVKPRTMAGLASPNARKKQDGLRPNQIPHVSTNSNTKTHLRMIATSASSRSAPVLRR